MLPIKQVAITDKLATSWTAAIQRQPLIVRLSANTSYFQGYKTGILNNTCCYTTLNHAVAAVGWGVASGKAYVIIKNSWGTGWGESGYIRILMQTSGIGPCGNQQYGYEVKMQAYAAPI